MIPGRIGAAEAASYLGISAVSFSKLVHLGVFEHQGRDGYDLKTVTRAACEHWRRQAAGRGEPGEERVLSSARARQAAATADMVELRTRIAAGSYVSLDLVGRQLDTLFTEFRETCLSLPGELADALTMRQRDEVNERLTAAIYDLLERLAVGNVVPDGPEADRDDAALKHARRYRSVAHGLGKRDHLDGQHPARQNGR